VKDVDVVDGHNEFCALVIVAGIHGLPFLLDKNP
jgi:hypothetical protein